MKRTIITLFTVLVAMLGLANAAAADEYCKYGNVEYRISGYRAYVYRVDENVTSLTIPRQIYNIGYYDVVGIDAGAFSYTDITTLSMWGTITTINETFADCPKLTGITVDKSNEKFASVSGCLYNKDKTELLCVPRAKTGEYVMPSTVSVVNSNALDSSNKLTGVTINNLVKDIETVTSPGSLTQILTASDNPYYNSVDGVLYSKDMKTIVRYPAGKTNVAYQVVDGVATIGEKAFSGCSKLYSVNLPDSVYTIERYAFSGCSALETMSLGQIKKIGVGAFSGCNGLEFVSFSGLLESVDSYAFEKCKSLKSIAFYGPVRLGSNVFQNCTGLLEADLTCLDTISSSMFYGCTALNKVKFSGILREIGAAAFRSCTALTAIELPEGLEKIQNSAFSGCTRLNTVVLPDSVMELGVQVFYNTNAMPKTTTAGNCTYIATATNSYGILSGVATDATSISINNKTKVIAGEAAENCTKLVSVTIPKGVVSIGNEAFNGCSALANVNIPEGVKIIGSSAFCGTAIENVNIPDSVTAVGSNAFKNCKKLKTAILGDGMTAVPEYMFYSCNSLERASLGKNIQKIGGWAFNGCASLSQFNFPEGLTEIGISAFSYCINLTRAEFSDSLRLIGSSAFGGCTKLETISFGNSSPSIGQSAFFGGCADAKVYIESIEAWCNTQFVWASSNPAATGAELYLDNKLITDLVIPEAVTEIKDFAFAELAHIETVTLHKSLKKIGSTVFSDCKRLKTVYYSGTEQDWADIEISSGNTPLSAAELVYIRPVVVKNKQGETVGMEHFAVGTAADLSKIDIDIKGYKPVYYKDAGCTVPCTEIPVGNTGAVVYADFIKYCTESVIDRATVKVNVYGLPNGSDIAVVMYNDEGLMNVKIAQYNGEELKADIVKGSTYAKIMAFEQLETLEPLCDAELLEF